MPFCNKCGSKAQEEDTFCEKCGNKIQELLEDVKEKAEDIEEEAEELVKKTSHKGFFIFIIFLIIIGYIILDLWAISQLTPVISLGGIWASISNANMDIGLTQTSASTTIRIENPTFVPILFARISYDANYGNTKVAEGKTGFFIIGPNSQKDIPVDLTVYHLSTLKSGAQWIWNTITGKQERKYTNIYADIGITKFKIATLE